MNNTKMNTKERIMKEFEKEFKVKFNKNFYPDDFDFIEYQKNIQDFLSQALDETIRAVCEELRIWTADWVNKYCNTCGRLIVCHSSKIVNYCEKCGRLLETLDKPI